MSAASVASSEPQVPWWLVLLEGIALLILGILLLANPGMTTIILVQFLGIYWLIAGIFKIIAIFLDSSLWGWKLFAGIVGIIAGVIVIQHPVWSPLVIGTVLVIILGIQGLIMGGVSIYQAFKGAGWGVGLLGALSVLFGILLFCTVRAAEDLTAQVGRHDDHRVLEIHGAALAIR